LSRQFVEADITSHALATSQRAQAKPRSSRISDLVLAAL
jgi:hypothetical protein